MTIVNDDAQLRQFEVLWSEIARRSNAQQALLAATVTITGTIGGLVVTNRADSVLLVVLAIVSPVLGLLWLDHARNIGEIGNFIRVNWHWTPNWEQANADGKNATSGRARFVIFATAVTIVFLCPALAGLGASVSHLASVPYRIGAWSVALLLSCLFGLSWAIQIWQSWSASPSQSVI